MCGDWEGKSWDVIESDYPVEHNLWRNAPEKFSAPNGESMERVYNRIREAIDGIARENDGKRVAVVSHGCALRNYMCHARFGDIKRLRDADWIEHTSITCVRYYERSIEVVFANDFAHLDESLTTLKKAPYRNLSETVKTK